MLSVVELAAEIGYTHPSTISLLKELEKEKIIRSKKDKQDERKRLILLTEKGKKLLEQMQPVWDIMVLALTDVTNTTNNIMKAIAEVEQKLEEQSFLERAKKYRHLSNSF
ncbi:MarR family winged helix-turn-helix transcriptional regulator [Pedobacter panaciterrae]